MNFFRRYPKFWIAIWSIFGIGGALMIFNALFDHGFYAVLFEKGLIGIGLAGMMINYLVPEVRNKNAQN